MFPDHSLNPSSVWSVTRSETQITNKRSKGKKSLQTSEITRDWSVIFFTSHCCWNHSAFWHEEHNYTLKLKQASNKQTISSHFDVITEAAILLTLSTLLEFLFVSIQKLKMLNQKLIEIPVNSLNKTLLVFVNKSLEKINVFHPQIPLFNILTRV